MVLWYILVTLYCDRPLQKSTRQSAAECILLCKPPWEAVYLYCKLTFIEAMNRDGIVPAKTLLVWTKGDRKKWDEMNTVRFLRPYRTNRTIEPFGCKHALFFKKREGRRRQFRDHQSHSLSFNTLCLSGEILEVGALPSGSGRQHIEPRRIIPED